MHLRAVKFGVVGVFFVAVGCGGSSGGGSGTCTIHASPDAGGTFDECYTYTGSAWGQVASQTRQACAQEGGTFSSSACAPTSAGFCIVDKGTPTEFKWTFTENFDGGSDTLQSECARAGGVYSAT